MPSESEPKQEGGREDSPTPAPIDNPEMASDAVYASRRYFRSASKERAQERARSQAVRAQEEPKIQQEQSEDPRTWTQGLITGNMVLRDEVRSMTSMDLQACWFALVPVLVVYHYLCESMTWAAR